MLDFHDDIPKHNRLSKEVSRKERSLLHSGVYEKFKGDDTWMWSDTASFDQRGPGDVAKVRDPLAHNFASPSVG